MALHLFKEKGIPLDRQRFDWQDLARTPYSKLDDDAFTRARAILMNGLELEAQRFSRSCARMNRHLQVVLAEVRRVEHHQATLINWLSPPDQSTLETTLAHEQVEIEVTAGVAQVEPDPYLAQVYRYGMLEDFDHLYRFGALTDRLEGKDPNNILQSYSDLVPGRPTAQAHRAPIDDLRAPYDRRSAGPLTKLNALTILATEQQTHGFYLNVGPMFADPVARQLYAEIASIEEQHVTQYESIIDPDESWIEKWMLHEASEVYGYFSCLAYETNRRLKAVWERFLAYELGHLHVAMDMFKRIEGRDPEEVLPKTLPEPIRFESHRDFIRQVLRDEGDLRAVGTTFVPSAQVPRNGPSIAYRRIMNQNGSPSEVVAEGYRWWPGTELARRAADEGLAGSLA